MTDAKILGELEQNHDGRIWKAVAGPKILGDVVYADPTFSHCTPIVSDSMYREAKQIALEHNAIPGLVADSRALAAIRAFCAEPPEHYGAEGIDACNEVIGMIDQPGGQP